MRKYKNFFRGFRFLKYNKFSWDRLKSSISWNIRSFFRVFVSWNIRDSFSGFSVSWNFLILELKSLVSRNIMNFCQGGFFYYCELGSESVLGSCIIYYWIPIFSWPWAFLWYLLFLQCHQLRNLQLINDGHSYNSNESEVLPSFLIKEHYVAKKELKSSSFILKLVTNEIIQLF